MTYALPAKSEYLIKLFEGSTIDTLHSQSKHRLISKFLAYSWCLGRAVVMGW